MSTCIVCGVRQASSICVPCRQLRRQHTRNKPKDGQPSEPFDWDMEVSTRFCRRVKRLGLKTLQDLSGLTIAEFAGHKIGIGRKTIREAEEVLAEHGLAFEDERFHSLLLGLNDTQDILRGVLRALGKDEDSVSDVLAALRSLVAGHVIRTPMVK